MAIFWKSEKTLSKNGPNSLLLVDFQFLFKHIDVVSKAMIIDLDAHQVTIVFFCQTIKHCSVFSNFNSLYSFVKQSNTVVYLVTSIHSSL